MRSPSLASRVKPYQFSATQLRLLDAHFGSREVWLPMPTEDLVAALVAAQNMALSSTEGFEESHSALGDIGLRFGSGVATQGNTQRPEEVSNMSASQPVTVEQLTDAIARQWPSSTLVEKKAYHRIALDKLALGYAYIRGVRPAVEVIQPDGKYLYIGIKTKADLNRAISEMRKVEQRAAKKAAAKAKAK